MAHGNKWFWVFFCLVFVWLWIFFLGGGDVSVEAIGFSSFPLRGHISELMNGRNTDWQSLSPH